MLTISKPLSSSQAQAYHKQEFANAQDNYYTEGERVRGEWHGQLAAEWGLQGEVKEDRGPIGVKGRHLYLVDFRLDPQSASLSQIELPADELQAVRDTASRE